MARIALTVMFLVTGMSFVLPKLTEQFGHTAPLLGMVGSCMPAALLGAASWWCVRSFGRSWTVLCCLGIIWFGLFYAVDMGHHRGIIFATFWTITLPAAALIVEHCLWWHCARVFVYANSLAMALTVWFEYQTHGGWFFEAFYRFGFLWSDRGSGRLSNPNTVGGQLAIAAVLAFMLHLQGSRADVPSSGRRRFSIAWALWLSTGCLLTASRGAFVGWFGGMVVLALWGTRRHATSKVRDLVAFSCVLFAGAMFAAAATGFAPWQGLQERFNSTEEVATASGRVRIWKAAYNTWQSTPRYTWIGTGTGVAPTISCQYNRLMMPDGRTPMLVDSHNVYIEWVLSFGLVGLAFGASLATHAWRTARRLDQDEGHSFRTAFLVCFGLISMTYVTMYQFIAMPIGALIWAMLSEPASRSAATSVTKAARREAATTRQERGAWQPAPQLTSNPAC